MNYSHLLAEMQKGPDFRGFTLDQIRFMRGCTSARIEMQRQKLQQVGRNLMETGSITGQSSWVRRVLGAFSYFDYALLAFKLFTGFRSLRRHR